MECDCLRALGLLGRSTVVPSSPHSLSTSTRSCSLAALLFNIREYVLASRVSFQNPRVCSLAVLQYLSSCSLAALLFNNRAYELACRASVQYPRVCARLPLFCLISALLLTCRASVPFPLVCDRFPRFFSKSARVLASRASVQNPRSSLIAALLLKSARASLGTLLSNICARAYLLRLYSTIHAHCLHGVTLFNIRALVHLPFLFLTSELVFTWRNMFHNRIKLYFN
jgi:hypothetical protein